MKIQETYFANNDCSSLIFEKNHVFIEEETPQSNKVATVAEELDGIDIDGIGKFWNYWKIGKLLDLTGLMFINEAWGNLTVVVDGGELTRNNDWKRKSEVSQAYICQILTRLGYDFSCGYFFEGRQQIN